MCEVILQMLCFIFQSISARFQPFTDIETEAVFSLDEDAQEIMRYSDDH
jgi:hypothetical protein